jgi:hypothetical protein
LPAPKKIPADRSSLDAVVEISVVHEHLIGTFFDFHDAHLYPCAMTVQFLGLRLSVVGLLVALTFIGAGLRPAIFAAVMLAVLVALVAFEISRNLRPDAHPRNKPSAE